MLPYCRMEASADRGCCASKARRFWHSLATSKPSQTVLSLMPSSNLSQAITSEQWDHAISLLQRNASLARVYSNRAGFFEGIKVSTVLPLHESCANEAAPLELVQALILAHPDGLKLPESAYQRLPLHIACRKHANPHVVDLLLQKYSYAALVPDILGRLPIHYALSNGADTVILDMLMEAHPEAARGNDRRGWIPLHVACSVGASTHVVQNLLQAYPEASIFRTNKGTSAEKCLESHEAKNKKEILSLLEEHRSLVFNRLGKPAKRPSLGRDVV
jgi:Ankyrin repeats (3 copies)